MVVENLLPKGTPINGYFVEVLVLLIFIQFYMTLKRSKPKFRINKQNEEYLGFEDLPPVKTWIPFKFIGNLPQLLPLSRFLKTAEKWSKTYGDIFTATALNERWVILNSGTLIQTLLKSYDLGHMSKPPSAYSVLKPFLTSGVVVTNGQLWQRDRKILLKSQHFQQLKSYVPLLNRHGEALVEELHLLFADGKPHEISDLINIAFLGSICDMVAGKNLNLSLELEEYHHNFNIWKEFSMKQLTNPLLWYKLFWMFHPKAKAYARAVQGLHEFAERRLIQHKEDLADANRKNTSNATDLTENNIDTDKTKNAAFYSVLDDLLDNGIDDKQIVEEVKNMIFGGHETGATAVQFLCFLLALNQEIQQQAREEVDKLFQDSSLFQNGQITFDAIRNNLKYVERCIQETLRLFPPVFLNARKLEKELELEYKNKTVVLQPGINIVVVPIITHKRAEYFPEPEKFNPDRFLPEEVAKRHPYSYIPFSAGPRNCLGWKFAMMEMKIMAAYILRHFEISTTDKMEDVPMLPYITLTPARNYTFQFKVRAV